MEWLGAGPEGEVLRIVADDRAEAVGVGRSVACEITEAAVGGRRTLTVAAPAHALDTLAGRYLVWYASAVLGGLPGSWRYALDTGPSAATCGLAVYAALVLGCPRLGDVIATAGVRAFARHTDVASREHIVALGVAAATARF